MKKLYIFLVIMIVSYSIYYDLKAGSLPKVAEVTVTVHNQPSHENEEPVQANSPEYFTVKVKSGDTILSLMEQQLDGPLPVPIDQLITDFEILNEGQSPHEIQIGRSYKLPNY
ncbi:hypothetical protein [Bacillus sp. AK031]